MKILAALPLLATSVIAADLPRIPSKPIAEKKDLLISEDFSKAELAKPWHKVVATFTVEDGALKGTQTRDKLIPAADGKPEVKPHAAVHGLEIPTKDSIIEARIKLDGASMVDVEFDDRAYKGSHYGHLARAQVRLDGITIMDERDGNQNEELKLMRNDPSKKDEVNKIIAAHQVKFPAKLEAGKWYNLTVETVGSAMRVSIDGKGVAYFESPGIGHETKSKIEFGVAGKDGYFDDVKVWNAEPMRKK
ncbi:hypothetical protein OVA24_20475 [Luteolibacter sp. SL250]|uniref:hypothetical protein n=1 Tax=Luteolibacter sp. SL250 TaxID=2995170 RepID=UPI00226D91D2|nr:hypothetical protein [Luteolibacter sp. SL250]WAC19598.1 hypothetical protein OVA24_20475 [Luteolibacter sp. SL250]